MPIPVDAYGDPHIGSSTTDIGRIEGRNRLFNDEIINQLFFTEFNLILDKINYTVCIYSTSKVHSQGLFYWNYVQD